MKNAGAFPVRGSGRGRPLKTGKEMAEELGIDPQTFGGLLRVHDGPKQVTNNRGARWAGASYFDPVEVRAWWKTIKEKKCEP